MDGHHHGLRMKLAAWDPTLMSPVATANSLDSMFNWFDAWNHPINIHQPCFLSKWETNSKRNPINSIQFPGPRGPYFPDPWFRWSTVTIPAIFLQAMVWACPWVASMHSIWVARWIWCQCLGKARRPFSIWSAPWMRKFTARPHFLMVNKGHYPKKSQYFRLSGLVKYYNPHEWSGRNCGGGWFIYFWDFLSSLCHMSMGID